MGAVRSGTRSTQLYGCLCPRLIGLAKVAQQRLGARSDACRTGSIGNVLQTCHPGPVSSRLADASSPFVLRRLQRDA